MKTDNGTGRTSDVTWRYGQPAAEVSVRALESELGVRFPVDFRGEVLNHDGGRPRPQALLLSDGREVVLDRLLATVPEHGDTIEVAAAALKSQGHDDLIPFAIDPFGNLFCFRQENGTAMPIVFWDHEVDDVHSVCDSFTDLLSMLREPG